MPWTNLPESSESAHTCTIIITQKGTPIQKTHLFGQIIVISFDISQRLCVFGISPLSACSRFCVTGDEKDMKTKMFLNQCGDFQQCGD